MADTRLIGVQKLKISLIRQRSGLEQNQRKDIGYRPMSGLSSFIEHQTYHQS